jgi:hypothetical protein
MAASEIRIYDSLLEAGKEKTRGLYEIYGVFPEGCPGILRPLVNKFLPKDMPIEQLLALALSAQFFTLPTEVETGYSPDLSPVESDSHCNVPKVNVPHTILYGLRRRFTRELEDYWVELYRAERRIKARQEGGG